MMASVATSPTLMVAVASLFITTALAGYDPSSTSNIAIYWGQNSYGADTGVYAQQRLSYYCSNTNIDIIPLAFLTELSTPDINFSSAGDNCTVFSGSNLLDCPQLEADIQTCQSTYNKTIMLSIGGATYAEGGFSSASEASTAADNVWAMFGPVQPSSSVNRPFGEAVIDGFDFDFESATSNMAPFAAKLRSKMDAATAEGGKPYYLSAAPQCPYPDVADNDMLAGDVSFDFIMVQFYNNYCGLQLYASGSVTQNSYNFDTWNDWAKTTSKNPDVRIFLGVPGSSTAAGSGYTSGDSLTAGITYSKTFSSFGGLMVWDVTQVYANDGFLDLISDSLQSEASSPGITSTASVTSTEALSTGNPIASTSTVKTATPRSSTSEDTPTTTSLHYTFTSAPSVYATATSSPSWIYNSSAPTTFSTSTRSVVTGGPCRAATVAS